MSSPARSYAFWPALIWLVVSLFAVSANRLTGREWCNVWLQIYGWLTLVTSLITFVMFWMDKRAAVKNQQRTPEKTLFAVAALGGWPGAVVGQQVFRHKSQKLSFRTVLWIIVICHMLIVGVAVYLRLKDLG